LHASEPANQRRNLSRLAPVDRLTLGFVAALALVAIVRHPHPLPIVVPSVALMIAVVCTAERRARSWVGRVLHDFFPVATIIILFELAGPVIAEVNPARWDTTMAALDRRLFGELRDAWFHALGRPWWLTDAASLAYVSYYFVPVVLAAVLYAAGRRREFDEVVFCVVATFFVSYVGYFVVPTSGPRIASGAERELLGGSAVSSAVRAFIHLAEGNELDAFPSGHTTVSLVWLALGWRFLPRWRMPLALLTSGIVFATVYLSFHYVIDVVAGIVLAALMPGILPLLRWAAGGEPAGGRAVPSASVVGRLPAAS
jgi:membrane-associated phospholipid phosphatase